MIFSLVKKHMLKDKIAEEIQRYKACGKDAVVIDSCFLTDLVDKKLFDSIVCLKRPYHMRLQAVMEREKDEKIDMVSRDMPYKKKIAKARRSDYDYIVINTLGIDELRGASERIYDEVVGIKTFDEQIRVEKPLRGIQRKMSKVVSVSKRLEDFSK